MPCTLPSASRRGARRAATALATSAPFIRLNTPEKVYLALRDLEPRLEMDEDLRRQALVRIERLLE